jgi:hypothetical protein
MRFLGIIAGTLFVLGWFNIIGPEYTWWALMVNYAG